MFAGLIPPTALINVASTQFGNSNPWEAWL
jgi:hypothetical protein